MNKLPTPIKNEPLTLHFADVSILESATKAIPSRPLIAASLANGEKLKNLSVNAGKNFVVGLDPGQRFGVAIYKDGKLSDLETKEPWELFKWLDTLPSGARIVMEDSRKQSKVWIAHGSSVSVRLKAARNVGEIDMACRLVADVCAKAKLDLVCVSPKGKGAKIDAKSFNEKTGWSGKSNQHVRDAAMVAWMYRISKTEGIKYEI